MATADRTAPEVGFDLRFNLGTIGSIAPVFPGFEVDVSDRVDDADKPDAVWHRQRARAMLSAHPEIKSLFGRAPSTAVWCLLLAVLQMALAVWLAGQSLWAIALVAYVVGSWANVNLFMLAHECNHDLVFKSKTWNRWLFTLTSLPMALPAHHTWWIEHHAHHNDLGAKKDFVRRRRAYLLETRRRHMNVVVQGPFLRRLTWISTPLFFPYTLFVVVLQTMRSILGLLVYAGDLARLRLEPSDRTLTILADKHLISGYRRYGIARWAVVYPALSVAMMAALLVIVGWKGLAYILLAHVFMAGYLHPTVFGMILSDSHFHGRNRYQPSTSYYGWRNWITFNYGLHTEHHDLPAIPWQRLSQLRKMAPEFYEPLVKTPSYARLALRFVFCRKSRHEDPFDAELYANHQLMPAS